MPAVRFEHIAPEDQPCEFARSHDFDQSGGFQLLQMMRKRRRRYGLALPYLRAGHARPVRAQLFQDVVPARIRERLRDQANLAFGQFCRFRGHGGLSVSCTRRRKPLTLVIARHRAPAFVSAPPPAARRRSPASGKESYPNHRRSAFRHPASSNRTTVKG